MQTIYKEEFLTILFVAKEYPETEAIKFNFGFNFDEISLGYSILCSALSSTLFEHKIVSFNFIFN